MILDKDKIREIVNDKEWRSYEEGFTNMELEIILNKYENINREKFSNALMGNTCMMIDNKMINYPWDVEMALICGIENRDLKVSEWD